MALRSEKLIPASAQQSGIWYHALFNRTSYWNTVDVKMFTGKVNVLALRRSLEKIVERHSVLRTNFILRDEMIWQLVRAEFSIEDIFEVEEKGINDENSIKEMIDAEIAAARHHDFDFEKDMLLKFKLLCFPDRSVFFLTINHINHDVASIDIFWEEMAACYDLFAANQIVDWPEPVQYYEYAGKQQEYFKTDEYTAKKKSELEKLKNGIPALELLFCLNNKECRRYIHKILLPEELVDMVRLFALKNRVIFSSVFQLAYFILLYHYSGRSRILLANIVSGRGGGKNENKGVIGLFADRVINQLEMDQDATLHDLLMKVNEGLLDSLNSGISFEELMRDSHEQEKHGQTSVMAAFNLFKRSAGGRGFSGLQQEELPEFQAGSNTDGQYDIYLSVVEDKGGYSLSLELLCERHMKEMPVFALEKYLQILKICVDAPFIKVSEIDSFTPGEQRAMMEVNATRSDIRHNSIFHAYERQVANYPDDTALVFENTALSYRELDQKANQLASYLTAQDKIGIGDRVAVYMPRSIESVICMLGILKCGACYVPISTESPASRIQYIIDLIQPAVILVREDVLQMFEPGHANCRDVGHILKNALPTPFSFRQPEPGDEAYVLFTSGSTGVPKGVAQTYRMINNLITWQLDSGPVSRGLRHLLHMPFGFDMMIQHLLYGLIAGHELHLLNAETRMDMLLLQAYILDNKIGFLPLVFSVHNALFSGSELSSWDSHSLKYMLNTGEQLSMVPSICDFLEKNPQIKVYNQYGPTETHVVTQFLFTWKDTLPFYPSIGKPVFNTQIYILDGQMNPVGPAVAGEIYAGGHHLANGYVGDATLTEEKFRELIIRGEKHRLYKTGDKGYWSPDGNIYYSGRNDDQVKLRGYRVEPGEIENLLLQIKGISSCVVTTRVDHKGDKRLVGYITCEGAIDKEAIYSYLGANLPAYMIPTALVKIDKLPLTSNGKVDKNRLPDPGFDSLSDQTYIAPRSSTEYRVAKIWSNLLRIDRVGIYDDFFELGGHSLIATRVASNIQKEFNLAIPIKDFFKFKQVHEIARYIDFLCKTSDDEEAGYEVVNV